jgi:mannan endo-1,4-beta-mannosidase
MKKLITLAVLFLHAIICFAQKKMQLVDRNATKETNALFTNLSELSKEHILFGHQHATQYGHGWYGEADRSRRKICNGSHSCGNRR